MTLVKKLYPTVETNVSKPKQRKTINQGVSTYIDRNMNVLQEPGPSKRLMFGEGDRSLIYDNSGLTPDTIMSVVRENKNIGKTWEHMNDPFNTAITMVIRYASIKRDKELLEMSLVYMGLSMYPSIQFKYFQYEPVENVMNYTIQNLSNKYKIRQLGSVLGAITDTVQTCYVTQKNRLERGNDKDIIDFIMDIKTRINSMIKNIAREFYKNNDQKLYLNSDSNNYDEDNYHVADSDIYGVDRIASSVTLDLITSGPNAKHIEMSAKMCGVSRNEVRNQINTILRDGSQDDIHSLIESIIYSYVVDGKNQSGSIRNNKDFLAHSIDIYRRSNTTNKNIINVKKILDKWMKDLDVYKKTQRQATINNFRRAIYMFFVFTIMTTA